MAQIDRIFSILTVRINISNNGHHKISCWLTCDLIKISCVTISVQKTRRNMNQTFVLLTVSFNGSFWTLFIRFEMGLTSCDWYLTPFYYFTSFLYIMKRNVIFILNEIFFSTSNYWFHIRITYVRVTYKFIMINWFYERTKIDCVSDVQIFIVVLMPNYKFTHPIYA